MRKLSIAILLIALIAVSACSHTKFYILGVDIDKAKTEDICTMLLGASSSVVVHIAGHYVAGELVGADIKQQGIREIVLNENELNNSDLRWFSRGGFVAQTLVNTALTSFKATRKSSFTRGFTIGTMLEIGTYPLRWADKGDLHYLNENGGEGTSEWSLYTGLFIYNFYRINRR